MAKSIDPQQLSAPEFRLFIVNVLDSELKKFKLERPTFFAVGMALAQFGTYKTGKRVRPTQVTLSEMTGVSRPTVRKILTVLEDEMKAIERVGDQKHGGTPSAIYSMRRSRYVDVTLQIQNRKFGRDSQEGKQSTARDSRVESTAPLSGKHSTTEWQTQHHNKKSQNEKNRSVAEAPSPAPLVALSPNGASDGAVTPDELISQSWMDWDSEIDVLLAGI